MDSTLFVIVENTDDTLGQRRWMELIAELDDTLGEYTSAALGVWFNSVQAHVQQVVWGVEVPQATVPEVYDRARAVLGRYELDGCDVVEGGRRKLLLVTGEVVERAAEPAATGT
jgi:hypothetical protein